MNTPPAALSGFQEERLATLRSGGSVRIEPARLCRGREGMRAEQQAAMDELAAMGLARLSRPGRYWAA